MPPDLPTSTSYISRKCLINKSLLRTNTTTTTICGPQPPAANKQTTDQSRMLPHLIPHVYYKRPGASSPERRPLLPLLMAWTRGLYRPMSWEFARGVGESTLQFPRTALRLVSASSSYPPAQETVVGMPLSGRTLVSREYKHTKPYYTESYISVTYVYPPRIGNVAGGGGPERASAPGGLGRGTVYTYLGEGKEDGERGPGRGWSPRTMLLERGWREVPALPCGCEVSLLSLYSRIFRAAPVLIAKTT